MALKKKAQTQKVSVYANLPASPVFSPHLWFIVLVRREVVAVKTIAGIDLYEMTSGQLGF